ncbi:peptidoglycan-binding protein [Actinocorallia sp. API 0066]|uniref:peptidoglycan-binding domain-containing protein n=1 Tax=Actinocorallia sp. API 0066 TaxID=2896846 RepID=UPI001E564272|nr:peptidoglycan-binding protein [Actinocorallia sp. API 0066]MCD0452051.1 peptidoglycan-binding protein [Actinocorallia sp. API 0066]
MRKAALPLTAVLLLSLLAPAPAHAAPSFAEGAEDAVAEAFPQTALSTELETTVPSEIDPTQKVEHDYVALRGGGKVVAVLREVGAVRPVERELTPGRVVGEGKAKRAKAGERKVRFFSTADSYGPGLLIAAWSERSGVNYRVAVREPATRADLLKIVKALPADTSKPSRKALAAIRKAGPAKRPAAERSTSSLFVDGAGLPQDDWGDEATLCNGCSYSYSNYTWLWQKVLNADGKLAAGGVDCSFGPTTANATKSWQSMEGLASDGIVGQATRGAADNYLVHGGGIVVYYTGINSEVSLRRLSTDANAYYNWNSTKKIAYTYVSLC